MKNLIYPVLFGLGLAACSQSRQDETLSAAPETEASVSQTAEPAAPNSAPAAPVATAPTRTIIYHGELDLTVTDFEAATTGIEQLLQAHRAYLGTARESRAEGVHRQEMTLKVPPTEFLPLVSALGKLGQIENKQVSSSDVTAEVLDAAQRVEAARATAAKNQQLLARSSSPAELARLEAQARQLEQDLSSSQAQLQQLSASGKWATLTLRYSQLLPAPPPNAPMPDFAPRILASFYRGGAVVLGIVVLLANVWPLLVLGLGGWAARHWWRSRPAQG